MGRFLELFSDEFDRSSLAPHGSVDPSVIQALRGQAADEDKDIREEAASRWASSNGTDALPALTAACGTRSRRCAGRRPPRSERSGAAENGARAGAAAGRRFRRNVRNRALQAIGVLRVQEAGPALRQLYEANRRKEGGPRRSWPR